MNTTRSTTPTAPRWRDELHSGGRVESENTPPPQPKRTHSAVQQRFREASVIERPASWTLMQ